MEVVGVSYLVVALDLAAGVALAKCCPSALEEGEKSQLVVVVEDGIGAWEVVGLHHLKGVLEQQV